MDSNIIAAVIAGIFTIIATIVTIAYTYKINNSSSMPKDMRQILLVGRWEGVAHQEGQTTPYDLQIALTLKSTRLTIQGEGSVHAVIQNQNITQPLTITGNFVHARFLKIEYEMRDHPGVIQFGFSILELSPDGQTLDGRFVGLGALISRGMVWGTLQLHKKGSPVSQTTI